MAKDFEEFEAAVDKFCRKVYGVIPQSMESGEHLKSLWAQLDMRDYTERLYLLCGEDVRMIMKEDNDGVALDEEKLPAMFWSDVEKYVENWMSDWGHLYQGGDRARVDS